MQGVVRIPPLGPIDGHVLELLSHHIVHGEVRMSLIQPVESVLDSFGFQVVVPGACYLEMILAGVRAHLGEQDRPATCVACRTGRSVVFFHVAVLSLRLCSGNIQHTFPVHTLDLIGYWHCSVRQWLYHF